MKKLLLVCVMAACGGGGPVDSGKEVKELTPSETVAECNYLHDTYPKKTFTCTVDGQTETFSVGFDSTSSCANATSDDVPDTCTATVGDAEDCFDFQYNISQDELCNDIANNTQPTLPASCQRIDADSCQTTDTTNRKTADSLLHVSTLAVAQ